MKKCTVVNTGFVKMERKATAGISFGKDLATSELYSLRTLYHKAPPALLGAFLSIGYGFTKRIDCQLGAVNLGLGQAAQGVNHLLCADSACFFQG